MNDNHGNSARLRDRRDQPDLVERIAGQAARDLPEPPPLSASALARIAARIEERTSHPRKFRLGPVLVTASVLLCVVTVASAARMDLLPRWIAKMVGMERKSVPNESAPQLRRPRSTTRRAEVPVPPVAPRVEPTPSAQEGVQPETAPAPVKAPGAEARGKLAMAEVTEGRRGFAREIGHRQTSQENALRNLRDGEPTPPAPARIAGASQNRGEALGNAGGMPGSRLAMRAPAVSPALLPLAPSSAAVGLPLPQPSPARADRPVAMATPPAPRERPAPPSLPAPVPAQPPPTPAPAASAPTRNLAARHLRDVVQALRVEHAPRTALDLLDRHAGELRGNAFAEEALLLRVEAMLALRQQPEALRLLDGVALANAASSSVLLVTRGQLRAGADRCAEAVTDFDLALARTLRPSKQALLGRAQCKQKLGDAKAAQADLDRLRREFPGEPAP